MTHRTVAIFALVAVALLALASTGKAQRPGLVCDGYDKSQGSLIYACADIDYSALTQISELFIDRQRSTQFWLRSVDQANAGFIVTIKTAAGSYQAIALPNPDSEQQTIIEFPFSASEIVDVRMQELHAASIAQW